MFWTRLCLICHRTSFTPHHRPLPFAPSSFHRVSTNNQPKIDFLEVEQRWKATWDTRGTKIQEERDVRVQTDPIVPFYVDHIRRPTIMGTLQSMLCSTKQAHAPRTSKRSMAEQILSTDDHPPLYSRSRSIHDLTRKYGTDIVRTCMVFSREVDDDCAVCERSLIRTQMWFGLVWDAVRVAHHLYTDTQAHAPPCLPDPDTHDDPEITDKIIDANTDSVESLIHLAPTKPATPDMYTDEDTCALWLASQEAILSMTGTSESVDPRAVWTRLTNLTFAIIRYVEEDGIRRIDPGVHYHSTRTLLSLLVLVAPSFAEESWLALHYGREEWHVHECYEGEKRDAESVYAGAEELIHEDLVEFGYQDLPRRSNPRSLSSILTQPFPIAESSAIIDLLKRNSAESVLRRSAERETKMEKRRW